jgi:hypothetical protein
MKTAGAVYRKLKEAKFRHLIALYRRHLKRSPENCKYNYPYLFTGSDSNPYEIRLCLCHQEELPVDPNLTGIIPHLVDVCEELEDCQTCNAFVLRHSREDIKNLFEKQLSIKNVREKKYPDICALEWVLERSSVGIPPMNKFWILINRIKNILIKNRSEAYECDKN